MSFSFGAPAASGAAPAPSGGGFSFGSTTPAAGGFSFGSSSSNAPAAGGAFGFGGAPSAFGAAPAPSAFGAPAPAPAGGAFGFGSSGTPAPAPGTSLFGDKAPAPGGFGGFGTPAPAPSGSFGFGAPAPAAGGFGFGSPAPAPFGSFGAIATTTTPGTSAFGSAQTQQPPPPGFQLSPKTLYKDLPPQFQQDIDKIQHLIMEHRRTMARVQSMGPAPLIAKDDGKGTTIIPIQKEIQEVKVEMETNLLPQLSNLLDQVTALREEMRQVMFSAVTHAMWPVEMVANTRGIRISKGEEKKEERVDAELYAMLDRQVAHVNRVERLPCAFFWQALDDFKTRLGHLQSLQEQIKARAHQEDWDEQPVTHLINKQDEKLFMIRRHLRTLSAQMDHIRAHYARIETTMKPNVLEQADLKEAARERRVAEEYRRYAFLTQAKPPAAPGGGAPPPAAPGSAFSFGPSPAPGASGFSFGSTPAPAPSGGFGFGGGATPAPAAPAGSSLFGGTTSTTTPASGGAFGSTTPAPAPLFGAAPAAPGGFGFGSTTTTTTTSTTTTPSRKKQPGRSRSKR